MESFKNKETKFCYLGHALRTEDGHSRFENISETPIRGSLACVSSIKKLLVNDKTSWYLDLHSPALVQVCVAPCAIEALERFSILRMV